MMAGRPTKYKPDFCKQIVSLMADGLSIEEVAYKFDVHVDTLYEWEKRHPEFSEAKKKGVNASYVWWLRSGRVNLENTKFSATLFYMNMKNRFGWKDRHDISGDGLTVNLVVTNKDKESIDKL